MLFCVCCLLSVVHRLLVGVCCWLFVVARSARCGCLLFGVWCGSLFVFFFVDVFCGLFVVCAVSALLPFFERYVMLVGWCLLLLCVVYLFVWWLLVGWRVFCAVS